MKKKQHFFHCYDSWLEGKSHFFAENKQLIEYWICYSFRLNFAFLVDSKLLFTFWITWSLNFNLLFHNQKINFAVMVSSFKVIGRSKGGRQGRPLWVQFLWFSCSFREKFGQIIVSHPHLRSWRSPSGKSWIRHWRWLLIHLKKFELMEWEQNSFGRLSLTMSILARVWRNH